MNVVVGSILVTTQQEVKANRPNLGHVLICVTWGKTVNRRPQKERKTLATLTVELLLIPCWVFRCPRRRLTLFLSPTVYGFDPSGPN